MRFFLALLLSFNNPALASNSQASAPMILSDRITSKVIATGDYEDFRFDSDRDGAVDLWVVKKDKTSVFVKFKDSQPTSLLFRRTNGASIQEAHYESKNKKWILTHSTVRAPMVMNGIADEKISSQDDKCAAENKSVLADLAKFTKDMTTTEYAAAAEKAVSCENEDATPEIEKSLVSLMNNDRFTECIQSEAAQKALPDISPTELQYFSNKLKIDLKKIGAQQDGSGLFTCDALPADKKTPTGKFTENGKITFSLDKNADNQEKLSDQIQPLMFHELVHRTGVVDEKTIDTLVDICFKKKTSAVSRKTKERSLIWTKRQTENAAANAASKDTVVAKEVVAAKAAPQARTIASTSMESGGGSNGYNMAKEISSAEVQQSVPSASTLASNISASDVDEQRSLQSSQRQSAPVLAMADRAMGVMNTPALASDETSSGSSSSSTRERYQARHQGYERDSSSAKSADNTDYSKVIFKPSRGGGNVVEEIDLTKGNSTGTSETAGRTTNAVGNSRTVASTGRPTDRFTEPSEVASSAAGGSGSGSGGSGTYFADGGATSSGTRKTNASNRRGLASQGSAGGGFESSRDEVITFISNANYSQTKTKLRDQAFQQTLSNNQISIIYADGSAPVGALRGTTVFLDDGSRFIMQRRK
ncbi:hypothetical protein [Bdellovibrio sp. HCB209]|uniref:hypothetical protein n=1 Tax=Bdellovibrio sp. HCB209 TaxID=3394354 RepID=UPI0039B44FEF